MPLDLTLAPRRVSASTASPSFSSFSSLFSAGAGTRALLLRPHAMVKRVLRRKTNVHNPMTREFRSAGHLLQKGLGPGPRAGPRSLVRG
jgi:hypothetical protein